VLTVINKGAGASVLDVNVGSHNQARQASVIRLAGPAVDAKAGISLGGAEVTPTGTWKQAASETLPVRNGQLSIHMPPASAAILQVV
jgi:glycosyl hydrolase family 79